MSSKSNGSFLQFRNVKKSYDQKTLVVKDFNLDVAKGEFITLLGPSGSGKTTVLMMLAGFESITSGDITIQGESIKKTAPYRRNIGMVFQSYALFPHLTVAENLGYPLGVRKMSKGDIGDKVENYLKLIELDAFGDRYPGQLSGGQRQRVALARALIYEPRLVLMDEPLGALDKKLREQMQFEISHLHNRLGFTVIYVTHDQTEALTMSTRIAVFNNGVVQQCAAPDDLYERPTNAFVADFIGENNFISGKVSAHKKKTVSASVPGAGKIVAQNANLESGQKDCIISVRPEKIFIQPTAHAYDNEITAKFVARYYVGDFIRYNFKLADRTEITVKVLNDLAAPEFSENDDAKLVWLTKDCFAFKKE